MAFQWIRTKYRNFNNYLNKDENRKLKRQYWVAKLQIGLFCTLFAFFPPFSNTILATPWWLWTIIASIALVLAVYASYRALELMGFINDKTIRPDLHKKNKKKIVLANHCFGFVKTRNILYLLIYIWAIASCALTISYIFTSIALTSTIMLNSPYLIISKVLCILGMIGILVGGIGSFFAAYHLQNKQDDHDKTTQPTDTEKLLSKFMASAKEKKETTKKDQLDPDIHAPDHEDSSGKAATKIKAA